MSRTRTGLLGLIAAILAAAALAAPAAQANEWSILSPTTLEAKGLPASIGGELEAETAASLLSKILGAEVKLSCTAATLSGFKLEGGGTLTNGGKALFTGCSVYLNGELNEECEAYSTGDPTGTIETSPLKGTLALHEGEIVADVSPKTGTLIVEIEVGACPIGEEISIEGELALKDCEGKAAEHLITHLIEEEPALTSLTALGEPATLDGSALIKLTGEHKGLAWGADA